MKGAREYAGMFNTGQYGKLYLTRGKHARGRTFHIQVLPEGEKAITNGSMNMCTNENAVEVFGVICGNPGWSEVYGWLHEGKWQKDFCQLVKNRKEEIAAENQTQAEQKTAVEVAERNRKSKILADY